MNIVDDILSIIHKTEGLENDEASQPKTKKSEEVLTGYSGKKIITLLQQLSELFAKKDPLACYLEVGVFQGLTLLSVARDIPSFPCYGIDNFAFFDPDKQNFNLIQERKVKLNINNAHLINQDYEDALANLQSVLGNKKIGVYFVDGPHDYRSQLMCLQLAKGYLHENAVIIVDDSNYSHVRQANRDFLVTHPEFKLVFQSYTPCHPKNMDVQERKETAENRWWNGINVLVKDPNNKLETIFPPTVRERKIYENEHFIHSCRLAEDVPEIIKLAQVLVNEKNPIKYLYRMKRLISKITQANQEHNHRYITMNTYSKNLIN